MSEKNDKNPETLHFNKFLDFLILILLVQKILKTYSDFKKRFVVERWEYGLHCSLVLSETLYLSNFYHEKS